MTERAPPVADTRELERQAREWLRRLHGGRARPADARALADWCARSPAHSDALRRERRQWQAMTQAAATVAAARPVPRRHAPSPMTRRVFLGGALAATAAAATVVVLDPLPGLGGTRGRGADYRTRVGERRYLEIADGVSMDMNTASSIAVHREQGRAVGIELLDGEIAVDALSPPQPFVVVAGKTRIEAEAASFEVRQLHDGVCITCLDGQVSATTGARETVLRERQQLIQRDTAPVLRALSPAQLPAWREGFLSFQETTLAEVVAEINRYRPGRLVVLGEALRLRPVSGRFAIADLDKAIAQIRHLFRLRATALPGGVLVLS